jgi:hypothetical protein
MSLPTGANVSDYGPIAGRRLYRGDHLTGGRDGDKVAQTEYRTQSNEHLFIGGENYLMRADDLSDARESVMRERVGSG